MIYHFKFYEDFVTSLTHPYPYLFYFSNSSHSFVSNMVRDQVHKQEDIIIHVQDEIKKIFPSVEFADAHGRNFKFNEISDEDFFKVWLCADTLLEVDIK